MASLRLSLRLLVTTVLVMIMLVPASDAGFWTLGLSRDVKSWSSAEVGKWCDDNSLSQQLKEGLDKHGVTGSVLLFLDESDLIEDLKITSQIERKKILLALKEIQTDGVHDGDLVHDWHTGMHDGHTLSFWEYRSMNRALMTHNSCLFSGAPRAAISMLTELPKHGQPATEATNMEYWLFPEYWLYSHSDQIAGGLPGWMPVALLCSLVAKWFTLLVKLKDGAGATVGFFVTCLFIEVGVCVGSWIAMTLLWPIIPWFICDFFFYLAVYFGPLLGILAAVMGLAAVLGLGIHGYLGSLPRFQILLRMIQVVWLFDKFTLYE